MWGEIDPPVKPEPTEDRRARAEEPDPKHTDPADPQVSPGVLHVLTGCPDQEPGSEEAPTQAEEAVIRAVAESLVPVRSQQLDEAELTVEERREELRVQYRSRPLVFLERYHSCLLPSHLISFHHVSSDVRFHHYAALIRGRAAGGAGRTRVRNQRYAALRALQKEGQYFSEEQMRIRQPLLYEQYIGQYLTDEEVLERSQEAMLDGAQQGGCAAGGAAGGLAHLLLNSYQERLLQSRLQEEQEREEGAEEEEEEEEETGAVQQAPPSLEEKCLLREEFLSQMYQMFLDGKDKDFNYSEVDGNPEYDNLDIVSRDAEDRYFDEDDEEEEEEEEEEEDVNMME